jgi:hypothetical protein
MATPHGIESAWRYFQELLETHGWRILGLGALAFYLYGKYTTYATRAHVQRTLREANGAWNMRKGSSIAVGIRMISLTTTMDWRTDPERVAVLRREAARVREQQQQQLQATLPTRKPKKSKPI